MPNRARQKRKAGFAFRRSHFSGEGQIQRVGAKRIAAPAPPEVVEEELQKTGSAPTIIVPTEPGELSRDARGRIYLRTKAGMLVRQRHLEGK